MVLNARTLADGLMKRGYTLVTGGTDNHLLLVDLRAAGYSGAEAEAALHAAGITVNKNAVPNDPRPPAVTSGIRIGSSAVTTRGLGEAEFERLAGWIDEALRHRDEPALLRKAKGQVEDVCRTFPLYVNRSL